MINSIIKRDLRELSFQELESYLISIGEKSFRANQIFEWLYQKNVDDFSKLANLPAGLQQKLAEDFILHKPLVKEKLVSEDKTIKVLFELDDKERIETVLIPARERTTACISTQAGCKFGCRFCASGIGGWNRNLTSAEILNQILYVKSIANENPLSNIVFMGVGEPLDNYDNLLKASRIINSPKGINIGARKITISTCGVVPKIEKLAQEGLQLELAISLHGSSNESRNILMPVNKKYPVDELIAACRKFGQATKRQITFEYILIKNVTCTEQCAQELGKLLKGLLCKMNLIPYNKVQEFDHETPSREEMTAFRNRLEQLGVHATIRMPRGRDVGAACGQLRHVTSE